MSNEQVSIDSSRRLLPVHNPATDELLEQVPLLTEADLRAALTRARVAQRAWGARPIAQRAAILRRFAKGLAGKGREVAELISRENGKTVQEAFEMEILPVVYLTAYFTDEAERILAPQPIPLKLYRHKWSALEYRPRGVVYVISPWNFPCSIPMGEVVMSLVAGNVVLHKPASLTPLIALKIQALLREAGLPDDCYQVLPCSGSTAFSLIGPGIDYVNFTGSTKVGRRVSERCGRLLIPCSMELGGKDPTIVLEDADLERAANACVWGAFANSGQICASVERVYIPRSRYAELTARIVDKTLRLRQGDPLSPETDVGAMCDLRQLEVVAEQVEGARRDGATIHTGGERPEGPGQFYPPTVLGDLSDDMRVIQEESFGPVLPLLAYDDLDEAIERANRSNFGLTASVFGRDERRAREVARRIEAGTVMLNEVLYTHAVAETPWAGVKESGTGRVHSDEGLRDLCTAVHINGNRLPTPGSEPTWYPYNPTALAVLEKATRVLAAKGIGARIQQLVTELTH